MNRTISANRETVSPNSSESEKNVDINVCIKFEYVLLFNWSISTYVFSEIMLQMQNKLIVSTNVREWITHTFLQINIFSWWKFCVERTWQGGGGGSVSQSAWHSLAPVACFCLAVRIPSALVSPLSRSDQQPKCGNLTEL